MTTRSRALLLLAVVTAAGGALRFYNLLWGAPYHHFHPAEHELFLGADLLYQDAGAAARSGTFFAHGPLPMYLVNGARWVYETLAHPLVLTGPQDAATYMALGRGVSAMLGTATIPVAYAIAMRLAGTTAGLAAAAYLAFSVLPVRDAHFFTVDVALALFCMLAWLALHGMAESGSMRATVATAVALGTALVCSPKAIFMAAPIALAHLLSPTVPHADTTGRKPSSWVARGSLLVAAAAATFVLLNPMAVAYFDKFVVDLRALAAESQRAAQPIATAHFSGIGSTRLFWLTNLLWWAMGPALEIAALIGVVFLLAQRSVPALLAAAVPVAYFVAAGRTTTPFISEAVPLATTLTVAAGVWSASLLNSPRWRTGAAVICLIAIATAGYAAAYMNVFRQVDSRVAAAVYLRQLPNGARVLVESSSNTPPIGSYFFAANFYRDYVLRQPTAERHDFLSMYALDVAGFLYDRRQPDEVKRAYIDSRLVRADWIVMDDTYLDRYEQLPESDFGVVKQYYRDLFAGRLGFRLERTFSVKPSIFGYEIDDSRSELSFRAYDHPTVYIFRRG
jgi:hypothetical protein